MCSCINCPEVEKCPCGISVEKGCKIIAIIYFIESIIVSCVILASIISTSKNLDTLEEGHDISMHQMDAAHMSTFIYALITVLSIYTSIYIIQCVVSILLFIGLTVKESTTFIRMFLILNYVFIIDDVLTFITYVYYFLGTKYFAASGQVYIEFFFDIFISLLAPIFSIYSQIVVGSHYKQVRRSVTGPGQTDNSDSDRGFVTKYLQF